MKKAKFAQLSELALLTAEDLKRVKGGMMQLEEEGIDGSMTTVQGTCTTTTNTYTSPSPVADSQSSDQIGDPTFKAD